MRNNFDGFEKLPYELLPLIALEEVTKVLDFGQEKHSPDGWRELGKEDLKELYASSLRHIFAWKRGVENDHESGVNHLAHAACNLLFIIELRHIIKEREAVNGSEENEVHKTDTA